MRLAVLCGPLLMFDRRINDRTFEVGALGIDGLREVKACCNCTV